MFLVTIYFPYRDSSGGTVGGFPNISVRKPDWTFPGSTSLSSRHNSAIRYISFWWDFLTTEIHFSIGSSGCPMGFPCSWGNVVASSFVPWPWPLSGGVSQDGTKCHISPTQMFTRYTQELFVVDIMDFDKNQLILNTSVMEWQLINYTLPKSMTNFLHHTAQSTEGSLVGHQKL